MGRLEGWGLASEGPENPRLGHSVQLGEGLQPAGVDIPTRKHGPTAANFRSCLNLTLAKSAARSEVGDLPDLRLLIPKQSERPEPAIRGKGVRRSAASPNRPFVHRAAFRLAG